MCNKNFIYAQFLLAAVLSPYGYAAGFDCSKASHQTEKIICSNQTLSLLDEELNRDYRYALTQIRSKKALKASQREWLKAEVRDCRDAECIMRAYQTRIQLLNGIAPLGDSTNNWSGEYVRYAGNKPDRNGAGIFILGMKRGRIYASGNAIWDSGENNGNVNSGMLEATGQVEGNKAVFGDDGCNAVMELTGHKLRVTNELGCGGLGVTFNGLYIKQ